MTRAISSLRKAAILLRTLDATAANQLLGELDAASAEAVTAELARLDGVDPDDQTQVFEELKHLWDRDAKPGDARSSGAPPVSNGSGNDPSAITSVVAPGRVPPSSGDGRCIESALAGKQRAASAHPTNNAANPVLFGCLKGVPLQTLCSALRQEQPRVIALVLSHLPAGRAAKVLENLHEPLQHDVVRYMTTPMEVQHALAQQVEARLRGRIEAGMTVGQRQADGVTLAARLLNRTARTTAGRILAGLGREHPELAAQLHQRRWCFDNLADVDDGLLGVTVSHMEPADLALALKGASPRLRRRCFRLLPKPVARRVKGHMNGLGPVRLSDIEAAQAYLITLLEEVSSVPGDLARSG